jgi:hypothetical protein
MDGPLSLDLVAGAAHEHAVLRPACALEDLPRREYAVVVLIDGFDRPRLDNKTAIVRATARMANPAFTVWILLRQRNAVHNQTEHDDHKNNGDGPAYHCPNTMLALNTSQNQIATNTK